MSNQNLIKNNTVSAHVASLPAISAEQYQHVGRYAGAVVLSAFEQIGGAQRLTQWADENPTDFYTKMFTKMIGKSVTVDANVNISIDDAIGRLEALSSFDSQYQNHKIENAEIIYDL